MGGRRLPAWGGRGGGGGSTINAGIYQRGRQEDYENWPWSSEEILSSFQSIETELTPEWVNGGSVAQEFLDAAVKNGGIASPRATKKGDGGSSKLPQELSFTTSNGIYSGIWFTTAGGRRRTSWDAFIAPVLDMPNLTVLHDFFAHRILWEKSENGGGQLRASGVEGVLNGSPLRISFSCSNSIAYAVGSGDEPHEILLCCGAVGSPVLLMHSGVGPRRCLEHAGISVSCDAPHVGVGLQDHVVLPIGWYVPSGSNASLSTTITHSNGVRATVEGKASNGSAVQLLLHDFTNVIEIIESCSRYLFVSTLIMWFMFVIIWILFNIPFSRMLLRLLLKRRFFVTSVCLTGVTSSGNITLASPDPYTMPIIDPCYLSQETEWAALEDGLKLALSSGMWERKCPEGSLSPIPLLPSFLYTHGGGKGFRQLVKDFVLPYFHHCASCRMPYRTPQRGSSNSSSTSSEWEEGAVDSELRVRGVGGVRVIDCSIACHIPSSPTNAMAMMIGDCAARIIIDRWANSKKDGISSSNSMGFSSLMSRIAEGQLSPESL